MNGGILREQALYKRRIFHYKEKYESVSLESIVELITLIPEILVNDSKIKMSEFIVFENNFDGVIHYLDWLDSLADTIGNKKYFTVEQQEALTEHRELSLNEFLTTQGMIYYPYVILENIRIKIMKLIRVLDESKSNPDLNHYYNRRIQGYTAMISQPVFAIGELAALAYE